LVILLLPSLLRAILPPFTTLCGVNGDRTKDINDSLVELFFIRVFDSRVADLLNGFSTKPRGSATFNRAPLSDFLGFRVSGCAGLS